MVNAVDAAKRVFDIVDMHKKKAHDEIIGDRSRSTQICEVTATVSIQYEFESRSLGVHPVLTLLTPYYSSLG